jgi:antitoxin component of MazEF toxin-antitoxin module
VREEGETHLDASEERIAVTPTHRRYSVAELVASITPESRHAETDWGEPVGDEAW